LVTDLQPCKADCIREIDEKDYEVLIRVSGTNPNNVKIVKIPVIKFEKFESAKYQSILKTDIITITMGNTKDFSTLSDKIVICPNPDPVIIINPLITLLFLRLPEIES
jgi:hypothetical protein